jgi:hypothetical protein
MNGNAEVNPVNAFIGGLVAGVAVLTVELTIFAGNIIMDALKPLATSPQSAQILVEYSTIIMLFTVVGVIINILVGYYGPVSFSLGYLLGDFLMIAFLATALSQIAPTVLIGMVIAFFGVLLGLFLKIVLKNREQRYREYDYWG